MNLNFTDRFSKNTQILKFHANVSNGSRVVSCGWTDRHDKANCQFLQMPLKSGVDVNCRNDYMTLEISW